MATKHLGGGNTQRHICLYAIDFKQARRAAANWQYVECRQPMPLAKTTLSRCETEVRSTCNANSVFRNFSYIFYLHSKITIRSNFKNDNCNLQFDIIFRKKIFQILSVFPFFLSKSSSPTSMFEINGETVKLEIKKKLPVLRTDLFRQTKSLSTSGPSV